MGARRLLGAAGLGVLVSGLLLNVYLAIVARALAPAEYATFGAFWAIALVVGFGAFLPLEQQLARRLALRGDRRSLLRASTLVSLGLAGLSVVALAVASPLIWPSLDGNGSAFAALVALCFVSAGQFLLRGTLIGTDRLVRHAAVMILDASIRLTAALVVLLLSGSAAAFCWALVIAIALAHVPGLPSAWRRAVQWGEPASGPMVGAREVMAASVPLLVGSACAQLLLNGLPVLVVAQSDHGEQAAAGVFVAAFTLAKAPLAMVVPLQSAVVPTLTRLINQDRRSEVVRLLAKGAGALTVIAALGVPLAWFVGPFAVALVFGSDYRIAGFDLALITAGVLTHIALVVLTQVHVARGRHLHVGLSWVVALGAAAVTYSLVSGAVLAAELGFLVGSLAGALAGCLILALGHRTPRPDRGQTRSGREH